MNAWPEHAHTAADREHAGRQGVALTEEERRKASLRSLWRDLAEKDIDLGVDWPYIVRALFRDIDDLAARLAAQPVPTPSQGEAEIKAEALREAAEDARQVNWLLRHETAAQWLEARARIVAVGGEL